MRHRKGITLLLAFTLLFGMLSIGAGEAPEENEEPELNARVFYIDVSTSSLSGDCILIESDGHYGLIDAGHRRQSSIEDSDGKMYYCSAGANLSCGYSGKFGESIAATLVRSFNVTHLDFVIATHAHSDHIGGIPGLVNFEFRDADNQPAYLVDKTTVFFYKTYHHTRAQDDDLPAPGQEEESQESEENADGEETEEESKIFVLNEIPEKKVNSWHSQAFFYQAWKAMKDHGCIMADLSTGVEPGEAGIPEEYEKLVKKIEKKSALKNVAYYEGDPDDLYDDSFAFTFGNVDMRLYNLLPRDTIKDENVNSIVASLTDGTNVAAFTGDVNVEGQTEQRIMTSILNDVGRINLLKAAHHGAGDYSNSRGTFDMHQPEIVVVTSKRNPKAAAPRDAFMVARTYAENKYGTKFYEAGATKWALMAELSDEGVELFGVSGTMTNLVKEDPELCRYTSKSQDGWTLWENEYPNAYEASEGEWMYFIDGVPLTGWVADRDRTFYFDEDGLRQLGLTEVDGEWYYFWPAPYSSKPFASMVTGWLDVAEGLFYFHEDGTKANGWMEENGALYYFPEGGPASTGWTEIDGNWYFFDESGIMQTGWQELSWPGSARYCFLGEDGAMLFGRQEINGDKFFFREDGTMATGWEEVDGVRCYFREDGTAASGMLTLDGERYLLDEDGQIRTGWQTEKGKTYYFREDGTMITGWQTVDGESYYFEESGAMATGWKTLNEKQYYFDDEGHYLTGWKQVELNGRKCLCHFNEEGMLTIHF